MNAVNRFDAMSRITWIRVIALELGGLSQPDIAEALGGRCGGSWGW